MIGIPITKKYFGKQVYCYIIVYMINIDGMLQKKIKKHSKFLIKKEETSMKGHSHLIAGVVTGIALTQSAGLNINPTIVMAAALVGAMMPDIGQLPPLRV